MKILKVIAYSSLLIGVWVFIANVLDSGKDERLFAGLGSSLICFYVFLNDFWLKNKITTKLIWKILLMLCTSIGIWIFVTNTLDSGKDEKVIAGFGASLTLIGIILKENVLRKNTEILSNTKNNITFYFLFFVILFTLLGLNNKNIRYVKSEIIILDSEINSIESRVDNIEYYSH
jgi:hypothetical protein